MLKHESQPIKKRRSESKRESVIFPSKLRHFNSKDAALFGYNGLCYCAYRYAKLAAINAKPVCWLINTPLGSAVITRTTGRLPKEFVEDPFDCGAPARSCKPARLFIHFLWRFGFFSWEYTWINPWYSRAQFSFTSS